MALVVKTTRIFNCMYTLKHSRGKENYCSRVHCYYCYTHNILHTAQFILHTSSCPMHTARCTLPIAHCTIILHTSSCPMHTAHCTLPIALCTLRTVRCRVSIQVVGSSSCRFTLYKGVLTSVNLRNELPLPA